jgi:hypothetical protein
MRAPDTLHATSAALRALADGLDALATDGATHRATIVTVDNVSGEFPGLTPRAFADAGRIGSFPCFRSGRKLAALREDVERWLLSRRVKVKQRKTAIDVEGAYAELAGVR